MTDDDLRRIEATLGISLPESYKRHVGQFPVPYLRGNYDTELWDDADELIDRNLELRTKFIREHFPWPPHWYFIGDPLTACGYAIDLRDPAAPVVWVDHCDLRTIEGARGQPFDEWISEWSLAAWAELKADGIDPEQEPLDD